jgi:PAS domain S-box-containing protein
MASSSKQGRSLGYFLALSGSILVMLIGVVVIVGWMTHQTQLIQVLPVFVPMQFNTALGFLLLGLALFLSLLKLMKPGVVLGLLVSLLGLLTLMQYMLHVNLGIDQVFMDHYITVETSHPGRMAPNTAVCFFFSGIALAFNLQWKRIKDPVLIGAFLSLIVFILSVISLIGYVLDIPSNYGWGGMTQMAVHTAAAFLLFSLSNLLFVISKNRKASYKSYLPVCVFLVGGLVFIFIWQYFVSQERADIKHSLSFVKVELKNKIERTLAYQFKELDRIRFRWVAQGGTTKQAWLAEVQNLQNDHSAFHVVEWVDPKGVVRWAYPLKSGSKELGVKLSEVAGQSELMYRARYSNKLTISKPLLFATNKLGLRVYVPIHSPLRFDGYIVGVYNLDQLINALLTDRMRYFYTFALTVDGQAVFHSNPEVKDVKRQQFWGQTVKMPIENSNWTLHIWPSRAMLNFYHASAPAIVLVVGLIVSLLLALMTRLWQSIKSMEEKSRLLLESAGEGIYGIELSGGITFINPAACQMLGYSVDELLGKDAHTLFHHTKADGSPYEKKDCPILLSVEKGSIAHVDTEIFWRKDGSSFEVEYTSKPILNDKGRAAGVVVTFRDIRDRKKLERQVQERSLELESSNKELEMFSYSVSHDLRAPLRHLAGFIELLRNNKNTVFDEQGKRHLDVVFKSAHKMGELIDGLLVFSRAGRFALNKEMVSFSELVAVAKEEMQFDLKDRSIEWSISPDPLPTLYVDKNMMQLVMTNLLQNSVKFTRYTENTKIEISAREKDEKIIFSVSDNGAGFDPNYAKNIFGVFQRLHKSSEFEGTGIGLANVERIIRRHGGEVWAEGEVGKGATIYFSLAKKLQEVANG